MSLRTRIVYILAVVVVLYAAIDNGTLRVFASRFFEAWEVREGEDKLERVVQSLEDEVADLAERARVWGSMDELRALVAPEDEGDEPAGRAYVERQLGRRALESTGVDVFYVCDRDGNVRWSLVQDPETGEPMRLTKTLPSGRLGRSSRLVSIRTGEEGVQGVMTTDRWPLLVASIPVTDAQGLAFEPDDGSRFRSVRYGYVILGRFLDASLRSALGAPSGVSIELYSPDGTTLDERRKDLVASLTAGERRTVSFVDEEGRLHTMAGVLDLRTGEPTVLEAVSEREIVAVGRRAVNYALISTVASTLLILFVLLRLLGRFVLEPLGKLTRMAVEIGRTDDTTLRVGIKRDDEIGQLSDEFDSMLDKLATSRAEVVVTARKAGMSDIATGVLHNVGNVLNSVNVSTNMVRRRTQELALGDLRRLLDVLPGDRDALATFIREDPRGQHFLPLLSGLSESLQRQKAGILEELSTLGNGIEHIAELVRSQQSYAGTKGVYEFASLATEIEAALQICAQALGSLSEVEIVREFEPVPSVKVDKHKLMEILVNLIQNACDAMRASGEPRMLLTLRVLRPTEDCVRIEVEDNGVGIPPEDLDRVFKHGFTTKEKGHGFGLHVSANAATEMNASLKARSGGRGTGSTFSLDLQATERELSHAA